MWVYLAGILTGAIAHSIGVEIQRRQKFRAFLRRLEESQARMLERLDEQESEGGQ